jgi:predicted alpha-1,6-mannanase (GH76 family)
MKMYRPLNMVLLINLIFCISCLQSAKDEPVPSPPKEAYNFQWGAIADSSVLALNQHFWNSAKYYNNADPNDGNFGYWPQAHALDVLVDAYQRTKSSVYTNYMNDWYVGVKIKNGNTFLNQYYDDMEWNALAMLRAYNATNDQKWLDAAKEVWADIKTGWNSTMGGGIAWNKSKTYYKNTPANAPAAIFAARLYQITKNADDLTWAKKIYDWQKATLVNASNGLVYDGINSDNDGKLQTSPGWSFAYNQGTYIGAAVELYTITKDNVYLEDATKTASNFIADGVMSPSGIMRSSDNGDGGLFNGIGARYLALLIQNPDLSSVLRENYTAYLKKNAETLWLKGTDRSRVVFNYNFTTPPASTGYLTPQLTGCMIMEAMALLKNKNLIE